MLIEIHLLQNHSPGNPNRDDVGAPKSAYFGGRLRSRISSQCLKRSIRLFPDFQAALQGDSGTVNDVADALQTPVWPPFLGRKSCPPSAPVFAAIETCEDLSTALRSRRWCPRLEGIDIIPDPLRAVVEVSPEDSHVPPDAWPVQDVPMSFTHRVYGTRFVKEVRLDGVDVGAPEFAEPPQPDRRPATTWPGWKGPGGRREQRLDRDCWVCVFCKSQATQVHHVTYERAGYENIETDLRSVCQLCHDTLTLLEYASGMTGERIDPRAPRHREAILRSPTGRPWAMSYSCGARVIPRDTSIGSTVPVNECSVISTTWDW